MVLEASLTFEEIFQRKFNQTQTALAFVNAPPPQGGARYETKTAFGGMVTLLNRKTTATFHLQEGQGGVGALGRALQRLPARTGP